MSRRRPNTVEELGTALERLFRPSEENRDEHE
jgi:hypothetical protein